MAGSVIRVGHPKGVAHRGCMGISGIRELTLEAFDYAYGHGAAMVEADIQWTSDGKMVLCHDPTIDRVSSHSGYVRNFTLNQLKSFGFNSVSQLLSWAEDKEDLEIGLEIKIGDMGPSRAQRLIDAINDHDLTKRTNVSASYNRRSSLRTVRDAKPRALETGLVTNGEKLTDSYIRGYGTFYWANWETITSTKAASLRGRGVKTVAWTPKTHAQYHAAYQTGTDYVVVNDIRDWNAWLRTV